MIEQDTPTDKTTIVVCMGSSCYARGNARNLEAIQAWLRSKEAPASVALGISLSGTLCEGRCKEGPILRVGGKVYTGVRPEAVAGILEHEFPDADLTGDGRPEDAGQEKHFG